MFITGGFFMALITLNAIFQSANSQFYVDVEHSLPRIGKRNPEFEESLANALTKLANDDGDGNSDLNLEDSHKSHFNRKQQINRALELIKLIGRRRGYMLPDYRRK